MGTGYTRNDSANNIADGNVINASDLDGEFDAVQAAFNASTGHSHDGTTGEGPKIDTAGLADDAVTGAKIDSTTTITAAGFTGPLTGTASNAALLDNIDSTSFLRSDAADTKTSGDLSFSDNVKATFGAGSDLQIFSDGTHGIIKESGSGDLLIYGNNLRLGNADGSELYILGNNNAEVQLRYDNATKLATTATGTNTTGISVATDTVGSSFNQFYALGNGNVGGIRFGNTTKTNGYIYYDNGGNMNFHADGPERMRIDSSGRVGIGTSSPDFKAEIVGGTNDGLHIKDAESATVFGGLFTQSANLALVARSNHALTFGTNDAERMRIDSSGNLLVGTTTGGGTIGTYNGFGAFAGGSIFSAATSNRSIFSRRSTDGSIIEFRKDSTGVGVIGTQNWGIGTSNPAGPLEVHKSGGDANVFITTGVTTSSTTILFGDSASDDRGRVHYDHNNDSMRLHTAGSERMRIDSSGNVGIGGSAVLSSSAYNAASLHLRQPGSTTTGGQLRFTTGASGHNASDGAFISYFSDNNLFYNNQESGDHRFFNGGSETLRITSGGNVGIGTVSPTHNLDVFNSASSGAPLLAQFKSAGGDTQLYVDNSTITTQLTADASNTAGIVGTKTNHPFVFRTNNTERMRIDSSGNVGIGGLPSQRLHVHGGAVQFTNTQNTYLQINTTDTHLYTAAAHPLRFGTNSTERMRIDSSGRVGIGTSSPDFKAEIVGGTNDGLHIKDAESATVFGGLFTQSANLALVARSNHALTFGTNDAERMRIDSSGRVGIGTASPSSILHTSVSSGANKLIVQNTAASGQSVLQLNTDSTTPGQCQIYMGKTSAPTNGQVGYDPNNDFLYLYTNNSERMRITSAGNVGIGSSSAIEKLRVSGNVELYNDNTDGYIWFHDTGTRSWSIGSDQSTGNFAITNVQGLASGHKVQINGSGDFLVGTNGISIGSPGNSETGLDVTQGGVAQLSATGIALFLRRTGGNGDLVRFHAGTGAGGAGSISVTTTSTSYNTSSDHRLKENITDISNAIDRVKILAPKRFNFIADADTTVDGFLAHEAQAVVPEAVTGTHNEVDEDGNAIMQGIDQSKFVPLLTAALKEAITKIEDLETRLAALEAN